MTRPILRTARLELRPLEARDAGFVTDAMQDARVWQWLTRIPQPYTRTDALKFITEVAPSEAWLIEMGGEPQGVVGARHELGYWLAPHAWGRGIIREACSAVLDWWFSDPERDALPARHFTANERSQRVLDALGFEDVGPTASSCLGDGRTAIPSRKVLLTRETWSARRR